MTYKYIYKTPEKLSNMIMNSDGEYLIGLWFIGSKDDSKHIVNCEEKELPVFKETSKWLDIILVVRIRILNRNIKSKI